MKTTRRLLLAAMAVAISASVATAQNDEKLGQVRFPISCSPTAQREVERALAMLHSFWFPQAPNAFAAVTQKEPGCAMAYWGLAMAQRGNPLVGSPTVSALKTGSAALEKARALGARTPREQDYLGTLEVYYKDWETVDHGRRVLEYEKAMEQLHLRYTTDPEATVFYALALNEAITVAPADKTYARHLKAAGLLEKVLAAHPDHPGAIHYLIHSYDFPPLATRGLPAAQRYSMVASSAPHALHMPSHIFSMVGMWEESINSNRAALGVAKGYVHALDFTVYAHLQMAQDGAAKSALEQTLALLKTQAPIADLSPTAGILSIHTAFAAVPARYAIERGAWAEAAALQPRPSTPAADAITYFTRAVGAARSGDTVSAKKDVEQLGSLRDTLANSKQEYWAEQVEIQRRAAAAWVALAEGQKGEALRLMRTAAELEDGSEKHVAMENRLWPMRELLGELLLEVNEPLQALTEFEASLQVARNRLRGFYGAATAAERAGDREKARAYYARLVALTQHADSERPEIRYAKAYLSSR